MRQRELFQPVSSKVSFPRLEEGVLALWRERDVFRRTWSEREGKPLFMLFEGPPTANGAPGIHHVLARVFKDVIPRYKTMKGFRPLRKGGWDTHGLPVELEVERELGIASKGEIEQYGIDLFNARCRESVMRYVKEWEGLTERIGFWVDMEDAYVTYSNDYVESGWWIVKQLFDRGLVYQGFRVTPHCPRCVTSLSSHEVSLGYREDTPDPSVYVRFRLNPRLQGTAHGGNRESLSKLGWDQQTASWQPEVPSILAWTTTPWTLTANVALAVAPDEEYVLVQAPPGQPQERLVLAHALLEPVLGKGWEVRQTFKGSELAGLYYEPLYPSAEVEGYQHRVVPASFVGTEDGTGVVHIAPAYGAEDYELGRSYDLPTVHTVDLQGRLAAGFPGAGLFVKEADSAIMEDLERRGLMYRRGTLRHTYPFCWRCDAPLLYYAKPSWYIRTTAVKDRLVEANGQVNWYPEHIKEGRFGEWLRNNVDWAISRERYWGTPIPIWLCPSCGGHECFGSVEALRAHATRETRALLESPGLDLHRPYVDGVLVPCSRCGGTMRRIPEVMDCWFDSGAMPYAQFHYPVENPTLLDPADGRFPADYICEAVDQTRGWFYSLHALAVLLTSQPAYRNVICLGLVLDDKGEKMSKSRGNVVEPWPVIEAHGADALRWYLFTAAPPGNARRFSRELVEESVRRFLLTLWNTYSFFVTYANLDGFDPAQAGAPAPTSDLDRWVLSELNTLVRDVDGLLGAYNPTDAARRIEAFVEDLSTWYVRRSRRRFWKSENDADKSSAYQTLYTCLSTLSRLLAPFTPFLAEEMYQNLVRSVDQGVPDSVHLAAFPEADVALIDPALSRATRLVMRVVSLGRAARSKANVRVRQPLASMDVQVRTDDEAGLLISHMGEVLDELNVESLAGRITPGSEGTLGWYDYQVRPNLGLLGPKYGQSVSAVRETLAALDPSQVARTVDAGGLVRAGEFELAPEEIAVTRTDKPGWASASEGGYSVRISTEVTPELRRGGLARELVHRIQNMRRSAGFDIADRIAVTCQGAAVLGQVLATEPTASYVRGETLAVRVEEGPPGEGAYQESFRLEGMAVTLGVTRQG